MVAHPPYHKTVFVGSKWSRVALGTNHVCHPSPGCVLRQTKVELGTVLGIRIVGGFLAIRQRQYISCLRTHRNVETFQNNIIPVPHIQDNIRELTFRKLEFSSSPYGNRNKNIYPVTCRESVSWLYIIVCSLGIIK